MCVRERGREREREREREGEREGEREIDSVSRWQRVGDGKKLGNGLSHHISCLPAWECPELKTILHTWLFW